jgi:hypothetical protein
MNQSAGGKAKTSHRGPVSRSFPEKRNNGRKRSNGCWAEPTAKLMIWKSQLVEHVACDDELGDARVCSFPCFSTRRVPKHPVVRHVGI